MPKRKWTAAQVTDALRVAYGVAGSQLVTDEWAFLTEVPLRAGKGKWNGNERTIDVMMVRAWSSGIGHRRIAIEVKVSRSDYRNEHALKREPAEFAAHQTYYATPAGLIDPGALHPGWGLLEVYADADAYAAGKGWEVGSYGTGALVKCRTRPADRTPGCDLDYLVSAFARRASRAEERIRRGADNAAKVPALEAEVDRLAQQLERRDGTIQRERDKVRRLKDLAAAIEGGQVCADCGWLVGLDVKARFTGVVWRHRDADQEKRCEADRSEANRLEREARFGARYMRGMAPPVEPKSLRDQADGLPGDPVW